jgi:uncharacterized protein (TIGR02996 family)
MPAKRYFEYSEGTSNKFWEVWRAGVEVFTRYGKIGANGQVTVKKLGSDADARQLHDKLIAEKARKGYVEGGNGKAKATSKAAKPNGKAAAPAAPATDVIEIPKGALRLELVEGTSSKFWQIQRHDKTVTVSFGKIGTPGTIQKKKHKDEWTAREDYEKQLAQKVKKGYQYVVAGPRVTRPPSIEPRLEQAIAKDPSNDDNFMVYADWLQQQADPRGELATIQAQRARDPKDRKLANAEKKLLTQQGGYLFGPLAPFVSFAPPPKDEYDQDDAAVRATWRQGWIDQLRLSAIDPFEDGVPPLASVVPLITALPKLASARLLCELVIGCPLINNSFDYGLTVAELAKVIPHLPVLRRLVIGDFQSEDCEVSWSTMGKLDPLWKVAGKLEFLKLRAGSFELGKVRAPELRELRIETGGFTKKSLAAILGAELPRLEALNLWFGQKHYGANCLPKDVAPLLDGKKFPRLRRLGIANTTWGNELCELLPAARILPRLEALDLSRSHLTTDGIRKLVQRRDAFAHLQELDVSRCLLDKEGVKLAKTLAKTVLVERQWSAAEYQPEEGDDDADPTDLLGYWRYSSVGE